MVSKKGIPITACNAIRKPPTNLPVGPLSLCSVSI